jgi:hypothetical protein
MASGQAPQDTCLGKACVYILLGKDEENGKEGMAYIGESEDVASRLRTHNGEKEFWNEALVFCRTDDDFNKGSILYIEGQLIELAKQCNRYSLYNTDRASNEKPLNADDKSVAEDYIDDIKLLIEMLGCKVFTPMREAPSTQPDVQVEASENVPVFDIQSGTLGAKGQPTSEGFVVFEGSEISPTESSACPPIIKKMRETLKQDGTIGTDHKFTRDYLFGSPTRAAGVVLGNSVTAGPAMWKTALESGEWKTLRGWLAEQEGAADASSE